jgi:hypothetical protein
MADFCEHRNEVLALYELNVCVSKAPVACDWLGSCTRFLRRAGWQSSSLNGTTRAAVGVFSSDLVNPVRRRGLMTGFSAND